MPFGFNVAGLSAMADSANRQWAPEVAAKRDWLMGPGQNYANTNPQQNPNWNIVDDRQFDIQNLEGTALNDLWGTRHLQGADTTRSLMRQGQDREKRAADARIDAGKQADVAEGIFKRRTEGMGLTDRQKMGAKQAFSLNREVMKSAAAYSARTGALDEQRQSDRAVSGLESIAFGQQVGGLTGLANAEGQRRVNAANEKANNKANRNSMIGTLAGLGLGAVAIFASSEEFKTAEEKSPRLLDKLNKLRVDKWKYHGGDRNHIGPYAEEFNETFGVGKGHQKYLDVVDVLGVTLGSIKELNEKVEKALA